MMFFSIVMPVYNEATHIRKCIDSIKSNSEDTVRYEIIVVDNGSSDGTVEIVKGQGIRIIENEEGKRKTIAHLRNLGAKHSQGNILAFLDADMLVPDNWLLKAKEYFEKGFLGMLGFIETVPNSAGWVGRTWGNRLYQKRRGKVFVDFLPGRNIIINRNVFDQVKGFNEQLITGEDKDLTLRVLKDGYKAISVPDITVIHLGYERNIWEFIRKEFWRQGNTLVFAKQWGFSLRSLRNPLLSSYHLILMLSTLLVILFANIKIGLLLMFFWILPSVVITLDRLKLKNVSQFIAPFFLLTFLRWNVSGLALVRQVVRLIYRVR